MAYIFSIIENQRLLSNILPIVILMITGSIWLFHGSEAQFASAVFTERVAAESWIAENRLTGVLTEYPVNVGVYDWAIEKGYFKPKTSVHVSPAFIGRFTTATQEHFHYENGKLS
jgi:hypothetical protein